MDSPIDPWRDVVDIAETTPADFESRNKSANVYDDRGVYRHVAQQLADELDVTRSTAFDFALRVYLGMVDDSRDDINLRNRFEQTRLIPPPSWIDDHRDELPTIDPEIVDKHYENLEDRQVSFQTNRTVHEMVSVLIEIGGYENYDDVAKIAMDYLAAGYETSDKPLDERPTTV